MGIHYDAKIGKKKGVSLRFGTGDISFASGYKKGNPGMRSLTFWQDEPKPEEDWEGSPGDSLGITDEIPEPQLVEMVFTNPESVRILIGSLKDILTNM